MMKQTAKLLLPFLMLAFTAPVAYAQYDDSNDQPPVGSNGDVSIAGMGVKITQLQEQMRALEGKIEQVSFENKQLKAQLEKTNGDTQYRLSALEKNQSAAPATASRGPVTTDAPAPDSSQLQPVEPSPTDPSTENTISNPETSATPKFNNPHDLYSHALSLVNHADYSAGGAEFITFTQRYPKDPLIGNAYYWLGETQYVRRDYVQAANSFRLGYEAMPAGPKASENLMKLAMSLDALNKDKEACVVFRQVVTKFSSNPGVKQRAESEINRIGCN